MKKFAVLQLSGCAGCEMSLLEAEDWTQKYELTHLPLVISSHDIPEVEVLLISGGVRTDEDLYNLRRSVKKAQQVVAVGTCAISGGVASLGDREEVRELFVAEESRREVPRLLPKCHPIDTFVNIDFYLPGCPPTPQLFMVALSGKTDFKSNKIVCAECGRKKVKELRPRSLTGFSQGNVLSDICLIKQGFLCIGSSTRNGCLAPCPRAGFPCVGCRGPSDTLMEKGKTAWFQNVQRIFETLTDIPSEEVNEGLRSPQLALFLFQFSDYDGKTRPIRPKEKMI
jgi:F420-non-reducing hydrogenase small subunit